MNPTMISTFNTIVEQNKTKIDNDGFMFNHCMGPEAVIYFNLEPSNLGLPFHTKVFVSGDYIYIPTYLMGVCDEDRPESTLCRTGEIICKNTRADIMYAIDCNGFFDFCGSRLIQLYSEQGGQFWAWYLEAMCNYDESDENEDKVDEEYEKVKEYLHEQHDVGYAKYTRVMNLLLEGMDGYLNENKALMGEKMAEVMVIITPKPKPIKKEKVKKEKKKRVKRGNRKSKR